MIHRRLYYLARDIHPGLLPVILIVIVVIATVMICVNLVKLIWNLVKLPFALARQVKTN